MPDLATRKDTSTHGKKDICAPASTKNTQGLNDYRIKGHNDELKDVNVRSSH